MGRSIFINLEEEIFKGNVLDVGFENYGIVYDLCKNSDENISIEYVEGTGGGKNLKQEFYDNCVVLFSLKDIFTKRAKKKFIKNISNFIKDDGIVHIWDIDKKYKSIFNSKIKIALPGKKIKELTIKDYNLFSDNSCQVISKIIADYFNIIDLKCSDNIYYIKAKKKGSKRDESAINSSKFKVHSQQSGSSIFKSFY
ncbi:MAG: hypothetical protein Q8936_01165 [Bacillota bacterium]|nr:hypothetical protein [Bacillota bacterium]